ncbi:hypothetical protein F4776DRAFT_671034 [Hypoxylon sp. NC0597]|nr:hypothetical protein F4776DRAFT_671034 [Hypoxylon sp. NC0597]
MRVSIARLAPLLLYSAKLSSAYVLHSSCDGKNVNRNKLVHAIDRAIVYAADVEDEWDNPQVQNLKSWIFGSNADKARSFYQNILSDGDVVVQKSDSSTILTEKIVFFCSTDTLKVRDDPVKNNPKNKSGKITSNTAVNIQTYGDGIKDCEPTSGTSGVKAFTARHQSDGRSYIMICPWYLQKMEVVKVSTTKAILSAFKNPVRTLDKGLDRLIPDGDKTIMDTIFLLEQTMLHEITHTTYAGHAEDIDGGNCYDWKNVIRLSGDENSWKNAESLAFFGLAVNMTSQGYTITQDGDMTRG